MKAGPIERDAGHMNRLDRLGRFIFGTAWLFFALRCFAADLFLPMFVGLPLIIGTYALVTGFTGVCPVYRLLNTHS